MDNPDALLQQSRNRFQRLVGLCLLVPALALLAANDKVDQPDAAAQAPDGGRSEVRGWLVRVPLPITGNVDKRVERTVRRVLADLPAGGERPVVIFEFSPGQSKFGEGSDFGRSHELAQFLSSHELSKVKTVAFIPRTIKGHAVLVAMACEEIAMAPDAQLGEAGIDEKTIGLTVRSGYSEIAKSRNNIPVALALGMLDKDLTAYKVVTANGTEFVLADELEKVKQDVAVQEVEEVKSRPGFFTGVEASRQGLGIVSYLADDRRAVAKALGIAPKDMVEDPSLVADWRAIRVQLKGPLTTQHVDQVQKTIEEQVTQHDVNLVCLSIESEGGAPADAMSLATYLASLDPDKVRTVAYIPKEARAQAALVALACDQIAMGSRAALGGPGGVEMSAAERDQTAAVYRDEVAAKKRRSWSLGVAMIDPELKVYRYTQASNGSEDFFSVQELNDQPDAKNWRQGAAVAQPGEPLKLNGEQAEELNLANQVEDFEQLKSLYGLEADPPTIERGWAHFLIEALAEPGFAVLLLVIGGAALFAELQTPGIGVGGFVAFVCFLLYFWSQYLHGTAGWLEIMLFMAGISCLMLEIFVMPGVTVFGLGGGLMIIVSLVLASQTFVLPRNDYQVEQLRNSLLVVVGAGFGMIVAAMLIRRFFPQAPGFNRMLLAPMAGEELEELTQRESLVDFRHLMGQRGVTTTKLTPSGKARFGDELIAVISDGRAIELGEEVVVLEVRGNRVVVQSLSG